jgi:hypothetical protein
MPPKNPPRVLRPKLEKRPPAILRMKPPNPTESRIRYAPSTISTSVTTCSRTPDHQVLTPLPDLVNTVYAISTCTITRRCPQALATHGQSSGHRFLLSKPPCSSFTAPSLSARNGLTFSIVVDRLSAPYLHCTSQDKETCCITPHSHHG